MGSHRTDMHRLQELMRLMRLVGIGPVNCM